MFKNPIAKKKDNTTEQKISWYRRRWFWGIVLGVVFGLVFWAGIDFLSDIDPNSTFWSTIILFLVQLPLGFPIIGGVKGIDLFYELFSGNIFIIYYLIYYFSLLMLLFQTLRRKMVKTRYPLILITIIIISYLGFALSTAFST